MKQFLFFILFAQMLSIFAASDVVEHPHYSDLKAFDRPRRLCHFLFNQFGCRRFTIDDQEGTKWTGCVTVLEELKNPGEIDPKIGEYASVNMLFLRNDLFFLDGIPPATTHDLSSRVRAKKYELIKFLGKGRELTIAEINFWTSGELVPVQERIIEKPRNCSLCFMQ
jgi:hypothetical protein